ncbi:MAG TPA: ABC transporter permease [Methylibium sp.]|nr:ABC transporter permease [Methylibium sp.]
MQALPPSPLPKRTPWQIQRAVVFALFMRELKGRVGHQWLGLLWTLVEPVVHVVVVLLMFVYLRHVTRANVELPVYLVTGLLPFFMFRNLALRCADAVTQNRGLFAYRQVKPIDTIVSRALLELSVYSAVYLLLLAGLAWLGFTVWPARPLPLAAMSLVLIALGGALGLVLAIVTHERPRLRSLVGMAFLPLYLMSGVIIPLDRVPAAYLEWLMLNPVLHLVELSRAGFIAYYPPLPGATLAYPAAVALGLAALGMNLYRVQRRELLAIG